jgi:hypothetical protein
MARVADLPASRFLRPAPYKQHVHKKLKPAAPTWEEVTILALLLFFHPPPPFQTFLLPLILITGIRYVLVLLVFSLKLFT